MKIRFTSFFNIISFKINEYEKETPLAIAARVGNLEIVQILLDRNCCINTTNMVRM